VGTASEGTRKWSHFLRFCDAARPDRFYRLADGLAMSCVIEISNRCSLFLDTPCKFDQRILDDVIGGLIFVLRRRQKVDVLTHLGFWELIQGSL